MCARLRASPRHGGTWPGQEYSLPDPQQEHPFGGGGVNHLLAEKPASSCRFTIPLLS